MSTAEKRQYIHKLIDEADETKLETVLEILQPDNSLFSPEDLNSFYERVEMFEKEGSKGILVEEAHANIRKNRKEGGL